ncbi:MAG: aspartate aminotransferase [Flammeovirgaceae bacterium]|jgi:aspartate aminotransferase
MPKLSRKAFEMPESPIRKLMPFAEKAKAEGKRVIHLNIGQPDIKTPEVVMDRLRNLERDVIEYSSSEGFAGYREKLAAYYQGQGIPVKTEDILITTGGSEALVFTMMTCFDPGDEVIIPEPYYANYSGFATMASVHVKPITAKIEDNFAPPPVAEFEKQINEKTKGIVLCNPGNPTGAVYSRADIQAIANLAKKHDLYLIADEVYREFCYEGATPFSVYNLDGMDEHVILIDSVSKRYSMCGARIGAMITRNVEVRKTAMKFAQARLSPPTLGQIAAEAALETPQSYFDDVIKEYQKRRDILVAGMNDIPGVTCPKPGGAFYCIAKLPIEDSDNFCKWLLESFSLDGETVMLAPGSGFYITEGLGKQEVRIAYVLNSTDLKKAIKILKEALVVYAAKATV